MQQLGKFFVVNVWFIWTAKYKSADLLGLTEESREQNTNSCSGFQRVVSKELSSLLACSGFFTTLLHPHCSNTFVCFIKHLKFTFPRHGLGQGRVFGCCSLDPGLGPRLGSAGLVTGWQCPAGTWPSRTVWNPVCHQTDPLQQGILTLLRELPMTAGWLWASLPSCAETPEFVTAGESVLFSNVYL